MLISDVYLDNVHGSHGKSSTVHHAADVAAETDVVKVVLGGLDLSPVLLRAITQLEDVSLTEFGVVIKVDLGVTNNNSAIGGLGKRVDLDQGAVVSTEHGVQLLNNTLALGVGRGAGNKAQGSGQKCGLLILDTSHDVNGLLEDELRGSSSDVFDGGATSGRGNEDRTTSSAIEHDGDVHLTTHVHALHKHDLAAGKASRSGLLGDKVVAQHLGSIVGHITRLTAQMNTTLEAVVEVTKATTTGENHGLDDAVLALTNNGAVHLVNLVQVSGNTTLGHRDSEAAHHVHTDLGAMVKLNIQNLKDLETWQNFLHIRERSGCARHR